MEKITLKLNGMHCKSCKMLVEDGLGDLDGVEAVMVSYEQGTCDLNYDSSKVSLEKIKETIREEGYEVE